MQDRQTTLKDIALGAGLAIVVSGAVLMAQQVGTSAPKGRQPAGIEVCCSITAIDAAKGVITAKVTATGKTFTLTDIPAASLGKFTVGASLDLACAVPSNSGTSGATGSAATGTGTGNCGSNVPRGADTRPKDCVATNSAGQEIKVVCPQGVPIKSSK